MRGGFGPEWEIRMVRENLALSIACWTAVQKGQITSEHLPTGREVLVTSDGQMVEVFSPLPPMNRAELVRCSTNQVRGAFAFSAMQSHRTLESVCSGNPLGDTEPALRAARACLYLIDRSFRLGMLAPVWSCPPEYRQPLAVDPVSFVLDATGLDGKPVSWDDFGGLEKYLELLDFCAAAVSVQALTGPDQETPAADAHDDAGDGDAGEVQPGGTGDDGVDPAAEMVRRFADDRCVVGPGTRIIARRLYDEFLDWCLEAEREPLSQRAFGMRLTRMGFRRRRRGRGRHWWEGLGLGGGGG